MCNTPSLDKHPFEGLYPKAIAYEYFLYDSSKLGQVVWFFENITNIEIYLHIA